MGAGEQLKSVARSVKPSDRKMKAGTQETWSANQLHRIKREENVRSNQYPFGFHFRGERAEKRRESREARILRRFEKEAAFVAARNVASQF